MSESRFCSKCGAQLEPGAAFCPNCGAPVGQASGPTGAPLSGVDAVIKEPAAQNYWLRRIFAFVIDVIIVVVILVVVAVFVAIPSFALSGTAGLTSFFAGVFAILAGVIIFLYFIVAEVTRGATVGKQAHAPEGRRAQGRESHRGPVSGEEHQQDLLDSASP